MDRYLKLSFDNVKGRNCEYCMLSFSNGEHSYCVALGSRPICSEDGCRKDCPLIDNVVELPVIDKNDVRYTEVMSYNNYVLADRTRNDYRDILKDKSKEEIIEIETEVRRKIENICVLHEGLQAKGLACEDLLKDMK